MEKLKIVINGNEHTASKAKELFSKLGYHISAHNRNNAYGWSLGDGVGDYYGNKKSFDDDLAREVNLQQLHDMVVLKRKNFSDANFEDENGDLFYKTLDGKDLYRWFCGSHWASDVSYAGILKPIQKEQPMKEFLVKVDGKYELKLLSVCEHPDAVEVPKGSDFAMWYGAELNHIAFYKKFDGGLFVISPNYKTWTKTMYKSIDQIPIENKEIGYVAWQRTPNQTTIDAMNSDETEYLMQGANGVKLTESVEQLQMCEGGSSKKHSHYKKDVSNLKIVDVYRVLELFEVESHAVGHAVKKLLCSGKRGAKDEKKDIQEAIDSLQRHLEMLEEDEL